MDVDVYWKELDRGVKGNKKKIFLSKQKNIIFAYIIFCCMFLPDYCLFCGFPRSAVNCESLVFSFRSILMKFGFSKGVEDTCERKRRKIKFFCC